MATPSSAGLNKEEDGLEITNAFSSRPRRKLKPTSFGDEFYVFSSPRGRDTSSKYSNLQGRSAIITGEEEPKTGSRQQMDSSNSLLDDGCKSDIEILHQTVDQLESVQVELNDGMQQDMTQAAGNKTHKKKKRTIEAFSSTAAARDEKLTGTNSLSSTENAGKKKLKLGEISDVGTSLTSARKCGSKVDDGMTKKEQLLNMKPGVKASASLRGDEGTFWSEALNNMEDNTLSCTDNHDVMGRGCTHLIERGDASDFDSRDKGKHRGKRMANGDNPEKVDNKKSKRRKLDLSQAGDGGYKACDSESETEMLRSNERLVGGQVIGDDSRTEMDKFSDIQLTTDVPKKKKRLDGQIGGSGSMEGVDQANINSATDVPRNKKLPVDDHAVGSGSRVAVVRQKRNKKNQVDAGEAKTPKHPLPRSKLVDENTDTEAGLTPPQSKCVLSQRHKKCELPQVCSETLQQDVTSGNNSQQEQIPQRGSTQERSSRPSPSTPYAPQKRGRGRPPKTMFGQDNSKHVNQNVAKINTENSTDNLQNVETSDQSGLEEGVNGCTDVSLLSPRQQRRRSFKALSSPCHQQKIYTQVPDSSVHMKEEEEERSIAEVGITSGLPRRGRPPKSRVAGQSRSKNRIAEDEARVSDLTCQLCDSKRKSASDIRMHFMTDHSLLWSMDQPRGCESPNAIIKKLGHIDCQKCGKRFRFPQYYKHHQEWCGREAEVAKCDICGHTTKAMWLSQHVAVHKRQEKRLAELAEKGNKEAENMEDNTENSDDDGQPGGKRSKRRAAKNAIKLMNSLQDATAQEEQAASSDSYAEESAVDESDDSGEGEVEGDDDDDSSQRARRRSKKVINENDADDNLQSSNADENVIMNAWRSVCHHGTDPTTRVRVQHLREFYASLSQKTIFPNLMPRKKDWEPLIYSEREKYMPVREESLKFKYGSCQNLDNNNPEYTLQFGHSLSQDGKTFCYTGGPIWAMEWCPIPEGVSHKQVLAVCSDVTMDEPPDMVLEVDGAGLVQIWSAGDLKNEKNCSAEPKFEYAIAHDSGYMRCISWCPRAYLDKDVTDEQMWARLGLLAVACSDGSVLIYSLPTLDTGLASRGAVFKPPPTMSLVLNSKKGCGPCLSVAWQQGADYRYVVAGYGRGMVFMWDVLTSSPLLMVDSCTLRPMCCFSHHSMAVVSLDWSPRVPSVFVSASFDMDMCVWCVDSPEHPTGVIKRTHKLQIPRSVCWAGPLHSGFFSTSEKFTMLEQNPVSFHGLSKAALSRCMMAVMIQCHTACTWDVTFDPFYEVLVTCDSTGKVKVMQLPMKHVRCRKITKKLHEWYRRMVLVGNLYQAKLLNSSGNSLPTQSHSIPLQNSHPTTAISTTSNTNPTTSINHVSPISGDTQPSADAANSNCSNSDIICTGASSFYPATQQESPTTRSKDTILPKHKKDTHHKKCLLDLKTGQEENGLKVLSTDQDRPIQNDVNPCEGTSSSAMCSVDSTVVHEDSAVIGIPSSSEHSLAITKVNTSTSSSRHGPAKSSVNSIHSSSEHGPNKSTVNGSTCSSEHHGHATSSFSSSISNNGHDGPTISSVKCEENGHHLGSGTGTLSKIQSSEVANQEVVLFHDCMMTSEDLKLCKSRGREKIEMEDIGASNSNAIHRVDLNPNPVCCLWLATGGQAGLLRLDNLTRLVQPHTGIIESP